MLYAISCYIGSHHNDIRLYLVRVEINRPIHKSHNALDKYPTMHYLVTEMCTHVHISVTKWCIVGYATVALWHLRKRSALALLALKPEYSAHYTMPRVWLLVP